MSNGKKKYEQKNGMRKINLIESIIIAKYCSEIVGFRMCCVVFYIIWKNELNFQFLKADIDIFWCENSSLKLPANIDFWDNIL